ncbi:MAG: RNA polymerase sigma factor [Acidobacteriaceae bacterium]
MNAADEVARAIPREPAEKAAAMGEAEFERLYHATAGAILGYLTAVLGRRDVADDLLQETYCRLLAQGPAMTGLELEAARRYLFRIASNLLRDRWRTGEGQPFPEPVEEGGGADFDTALEIQAMLRLLNPKERTLLWLAYVEGMSHAEIAAATGLGRLSVRTLLFRARNRAKRLLEGEAR